MAKPLVYYPDKLLRQKCEDVDEEMFKSAEFLELMTDMIEALAAYKAVGISAPQLGKLLNVFLLNIDDKPMFFINPKIVHTEGKIRMREGCLSFPGVSLYVERAESITIDAIDVDGREFRGVLDELDAVAAQHEMDHLNGVLFLDHVSKLEQKMVKKRLAKVKKKFVF